MLSYKIKVCYLFSLRFFLFVLIFVFYWLMILIYLNLYVVDKCCKIVGINIIIKLGYKL